MRMRRRLQIQSGIPYDTLEDTINSRGGTRSLSWGIVVGLSIEAERALHKMLWQSSHTSYM